jgi:hypothetical protein
MARTANIAELEYPDLDNAQEASDESVDPRDISPLDVSATLAWALENTAWQPFQRNILQALYLESGDVEAVSRILGVRIELVSKLLTRARTEVKMAAKQLLWEEGFAKSRRLGGWPHRVSNMKISGEALWFVEPQKSLDHPGFAG